MIALYSRPTPNVATVALRLEHFATSFGIRMPVIRPQMLRPLRNAGRQAIADKITADKTAGVLPSNTDPKALAHFYATVIQGMSHQARDGASTEALEHVAALAMTVWPGPE